MEETIYILGSMCAVAVLCTQVMLILHRRKSSPDTLDATEQRRISERLDQLEQAMWALRDDQAAALDDMQERLEFTERMLTKEPPARRFPSRESTPV